METKEKTTVVTNNNDKSKIRTLIEGREKKHK